MYTAPTGLANNINEEGFEEILAAGRQVLQWVGAKQFLKM
jgi:hypothetical protein